MASKALVAFVAVAFIASSFVTTAHASPLWDYVHKPDPSYSYFDTGARITNGTNGEWTGYVLNVTSQTWLDSTKISRPVWTHQLVIVVPKNLKYTDTAGMYITGGGNDNPSVPTADDEDLAVTAILAVTNGVIAATLYQIPNAPIVFAADPEHKERSEDALVAFSWKMFMQDQSHPEWIVFFPMVKAAIKSLDTIADYAEKTRGMHITKFLVAGASKRGWTTWLAGAVDPRIISIAPIVMDMLNFTAGVRHMYPAYGGWTFAFEDYWNCNITQDLNTPEMAALSRIVDPLQYKANLTMPKLVIDATGDEFFMPDDDWYWWGELEGETYRLIVPNAEHSEATGLLTLIPGITGFFESVLTNTPRPKFSWTMDNGPGVHGTGAITIHSEDKPTRVTMYFANTFDDVRRDFRLIKGDTKADPCHFIPVKVFGTACINPVFWIGEDLAPTSVDETGYTYVLTQPMPPSGWRGFVGELHYPGPNGMEFVFTTQVSIIPNTFPYPYCTTPQQCKGVLV